MDKIYAAATALLSPLMPLWLLFRYLNGKEEKFRWRERLGHPSLKRPNGVLFWLHAASVGEANSVLPMIRKMGERWPQIRVLLTTGTRTSAHLMRAHLPANAFHQYVPLDTPYATERFMRHWRPDLAFWIESEFWPNMVLAADRWQCFMGVINARMSKRSFSFWRRYVSLITRMLGCFNIVFAQSKEDAARLKELGARNVYTLGNIKYDADALPCDEGALLQLKSALGGRPVWLAASTHPKEEGLVARAHALLAATRPDLLTVIVPRHPSRGDQIARDLSSCLRVALRSRQDALTSQTQCYVADTLGELGIFYRLADIVFMGGSLVAHGGQNPLEPARLSCAIVAGPHTHNFSDIYNEMKKANAVIEVKNAEDLAAQIGTLLGNAATRQTMQAAAKQWVENKAGATDRILDELSPLFAQRRPA